MNKNKKIYAVYEHDKTYHHLKGNVEITEELKLTRIFLDKEDAKKYLISEFKNGIHYSAIIEYEAEKDFISSSLDIDEANFITTENEKTYLVDNGKKELLKKR